MGAAPTPDFTLEEFLNEIKEKADLGDGLTREEIQDATGMGKDWVLRQLHKIDKDGKLVVVNTKKKAIDGRMLAVPAYRLKEKTDN